jgi:hypothetical protein
MARDEVRTQFALQAVVLSEQFAQMFGKLRIPPGYTADMTEPDGPSTSGGRQSLQHVRLHSPSGGPALVMGSADQAQMKASIRTYEHLQTLARQRGGELNLDRKSYEAFSARVRKFFDGLHFDVSVDHAPQPVTNQVPAEVVQAAMGVKRGNGFWVGFLVGALVFGLGGAAATYIVLRAMANH